jgi:hypothetical protein
MTSASHSSVSHADYPIWFVQTKLLLTLFTVLSGDDELVSTAIAENGFYTLVRLVPILVSRGIAS